MRGPAFSTSAATSTTARSVSMSGVVTRTPSGTMCDGFLHDQVHVAVDAGAGVPAAVEVGAALDADLVVGPEARNGSICTEKREYP